MAESCTYICGAMDKVVGLCSKATPISDIWLTIGVWYSQHSVVANPSQLVIAWVCRFLLSFGNVTVHSYMAWC